MTEGAWIPHDGSGMPVNREAMVLVKFRDGSPYYEMPGSELPAKEWHGVCSGDSCWHHNGTGGDIIAYRLTQEKNDERA